MDPFFHGRKFDPNELRNTLMSLPTQIDAEAMSQRHSLGDIEVTTEITTQLSPQNVKERTRSYPFSFSSASRQVLHRRESRADDSPRRSKSYPPASASSGSQQEPQHHHHNVNPTRTSRKTVRFSLEDYRSKNKKKAEAGSVSSDSSSRYTFSFADKPLPTAPDRRQSTSSPSSAGECRSSSSGALQQPLAAWPSSSFAKPQSTSAPLQLITGPFSRSTRRQSVTPVSPQTIALPTSSSLNAAKRQSTPNLSSIATKRQSSMTTLQPPITSPSLLPPTSAKRQSSVAALQQPLTGPPSPCSPFESSRKHSASLQVQHKPLPLPPGPLLGTNPPVPVRDSSLASTSNHRPASTDVDRPPRVTRPSLRTLPPIPTESEIEESSPANDLAMEDIPEEDTLQEDHPHEDIVEDGIPAEENSADNIPAEGIPVEIIPGVDFPDDEKPLDMPEEMQQDMPVEEIPQEDMLVDNTPEEDLLQDNTAAEDIPEEDTPKEKLQEEELPEDAREDETAEENTQKESIPGKDILEDISEESEINEPSGKEESPDPPPAQILSCKRLTIKSFRTPPLLQWSHRHGFRQLGTRYRAIPKHHCEEIVMQVSSYIPRRVAIQLHYIRPGWKVLRSKLKVPVVLILIPWTRRQRVPHRVFSVMCVGQGRRPGEEIMAGVELGRMDSGKKRIRLEAEMMFHKT